MAQGKTQKIGKSIIENNSLDAFTDLWNYFPQKALAQAMGVHLNTIANRRKKLGSLTLDNVIQLAESFDVDPIKIFTLATKERLQQRKKKGKK